MSNILLQVFSGKIMQIIVDFQRKMTYNSNVNKSIFQRSGIWNLKTIQ